MQMREKVPRIVISFHTTAEAMATEKLCKRRGIEGKLISAPRSITADCGIAWSAPLALRAELEAALFEAKIEFDAFSEMLL